MLIVCRICHIKNNFTKDLQTRYFYDIIIAKKQKGNKMSWQEFADQLNIGCSCCVFLTDNKISNVFINGYDRFDISMRDYTPEQLYQAIIKLHR